MSDYCQTARAQNYIHRRTCYSPPGVLFSKLVGVDNEFTIGLLADLVVGRSHHRNKKIHEYYVEHDEIEKKNDDAVRVRHLFEEKFAERLKQRTEDHIPPLACNWAPARPCEVCPSIIRSRLSIIGRFSEALLSCIQYLN